MTIYRTKNGHAFDTVTLRRCGDGGDADGGGGRTRRPRRQRVIVRGTPIPNTVDTFDVEEALRKAAKS